MFLSTGCLSTEAAAEEVQLNVYKDGLLEYLRKLTEGNREIRREVHAIVCKEGFEKQEREKSRMEKVLEEQNAMLKELVYEKEDEISSLERKIREMELASEKVSLGTWLYLIALLFGEN